MSTAAAIAQTSAEEQPRVMTREEQTAWVGEEFQASALSTVQPGEAAAVVRAMADARRKVADFYRYQFLGSPHEMPAEEAWDKSITLWQDQLKGILETPPDQLSWSEMDRVFEAAPEEWGKLWQSVKKAAFEHHANGQYVFEALTTKALGKPWGMAQYACIRDELARGLTPPITGIEGMLLDQMAAAYMQQMKWTALLTMRSDYDAYDPETFEDPKRYGPPQWNPPRMHQAEAIQEAANMADRFNRQFLRTLRALRDQRRFSVIVNNPAQVNIGDKQVNVAAPAGN